MDLAAANAAHFSRFFNLMGSNPRAEFDEGEGWISVVSRAPHPLGNFAIVQEKASLDEAEKAFGKIQNSEFPSSVFYTVAEPPASHHEYLSGLGYALAGQLPLMAAGIAQLSGSSESDGVECRRIRPDELSAWAESLAEGYGLPLPLCELCAETAQFGSEAEDSPMQFFGVFESGRMVSTSQLFLHDGIAGIYCVSTLPEKRGKGYGARATAEPMRVAAKLGYATAMLQSSEMGLPVYRKLGFEQIGGAAFYLRMS